MTDYSSIQAPVGNLSPAIRKRLQEDAVWFDVHCHLFTRDFIPDNYFHIRLPWLFKRPFLRRIVRILKGRKTDDDRWTQHASDFLAVAGNRTVKQVAEEMLAQSDPETVFCPLMMDMTWAYGPVGVRDMFLQLDAMREAVDAFPDRLLPFVALDPENPDMERLFLKAFSDEYRFFGVKIYPLLGYLPNHPRLMAVFEVCERLGIPVTTHCGGNATRARADRFRLPFRRYDEAGSKVDDLLEIGFTDEQEKGIFFNHPDRWLPVLERFPKLRLNLAHFGGDDEWRRFLRKEPDTWVHRIIDMMQRNENVYADVSFLLHLTEDRRLGFVDAFENLMDEKEVVRRKVLFGSDYYMVLLHEKLRPVTTNFLVRLRDENVRRLTRENPRRFMDLEKA